MADDKLGLPTSDDQSIGMNLSDPVMELVWENGQILVRGLSGSHSGVGYPSSAPKFQAKNDEDMFSAKRRRSDLCSGQEEPSKYDSSLQPDHHPGLFPGIYQTDFNLFFENARNFDSGVESQVVPVCKNSSSRDGSKFIADHPHLKVTEAGNVPNTNVNQCLVPELQNQDSKSDRKRLGMQNFSHLSAPATLTKINKSTTGLSTSRLEGLRSNTWKPMETTVLEPVSCAKDVKCFNSQPDYHTTSTKMKFVAEPSVELPPDEQSEAGGHKNTTFMSKQYCPDEVFAQVPVSSSANKVKENSRDQLVGTTSMCSRASNDLTCSLKTRNEDNDLITSPSNNVEEEKTSSCIKAKHSGERGCYKRKKSTEVHNMSERKRRAKTNKKMRELQELIPNSDKVDKASMLDQAIEYLKTLQLQVQIMQMGRALFTHSMMLPTGMQHIQAPLFGQFFASFGMGMHMGSLGCNPATFPASSMLGFSGQMLPTPLSQAPLMPFGPSMPSMFALPNAISGLATPGELLGSASLLHSKVSAHDSNSGNNGNVLSSKMQTSSRH